MTKVIWVDLDEVLAETMDKILLDNNYKIWNHLIMKEDISDYFFWKMPLLNMSMEEWNKYFHNVYLNDKNFDIKIVSWAKQKINELKENWYTLNIITWRSVDVEDYTKKWLEKHFSNTFDYIYFANHVSYYWKKLVNRKKSDICKELWVTIMIDDVFEYALDLAENWIVTYLIEKPWNKHIKETHPNIKRVKSWEEIII